MAMDTAEAEHSFSTVKRILLDYRRSMTHERLRHLTVLSHEKHVLKTVFVDEFVSIQATKSMFVDLSLILNNDMNSDIICASCMDL